ncbi:hypothetical protein JFX23_08380 [Schaalia cardiffensis]|uniref:hypothetical protein n=1 Tax=Schaalia cardiffensis TaxID=181487 RepID=UPI0018E6DEA0|nr:hypothetical protein [Schaalia cardiffensis]MBJ2329775.1 hypothetical protein [Schaalia cardiffensis]
MDLLVARMPTDDAEVRASATAVAALSLNGHVELAESLVLHCLEAALTSDSEFAVWEGQLAKHFGIMIFSWNNAEAQQLASNLVSSRLFSCETRFVYALYLCATLLDLDLESDALRLAQETIAKDIRSGDLSILSAPDRFHQGLLRVVLTDLISAWESGDRSALEELEGGKWSSLINELDAADPLRHLADLWREAATLADARIEERINRLSQRPRPAPGSWVYYLADCRLPEDIAVVEAWFESVGFLEDRLCHRIFASYETAARNLRPVPRFSPLLTAIATSSNVVSFGSLLDLALATVEALSVLSELESGNKSCAQIDVIRLANLLDSCGWAIPHEMVSPFCDMRNQGAFATLVGKNFTLWKACLRRDFESRKSDPRRISPLLHIFFEWLEIDSKSVQSAVAEDFLTWVCDDNELRVRLLSAESTQFLGLRSQKLLANFAEQTKRGRLSRKTIRVFKRVFKKETE